MADFFDGIRKLIPNFGGEPEKPKPIIDEEKLRPHIETLLGPRSEENKSYYDMLSVGGKFVNEAPQRPSYYGGASTPGGGIGRGFGDIAASGLYAWAGYGPNSTAHVQHSIAHTRGIEDSNFAEQRDAFKNYVASVMGAGGKLAEHRLKMAEKQEALKLIGMGGTAKTAPAGGASTPGAAAAAATGNVPRPNAPIVAPQGITLDNAPAMAPQSSGNGGGAGGDGVGATPVAPQGVRAPTGSVGASSALTPSDLDAIGALVPSSGGSNNQVNKFGTSYTPQELAAIAAIGGKDLADILMRATEQMNKKQELDPREAAALAYAKKIGEHKASLVMEPEVQSAKDVAQARTAAQIALPQIYHNTNRLLSDLEDLHADKDLGSVTGFFGSRIPGTIQMPGQKRVQAKIDQVQGETFLQAFNSLKGAGAITEAEGSKAQASLSKLGTQGMSTEDYQREIRNFQRNVLDLVNVAHAKAGMPTIDFSQDPRFGHVYKDRRFSDTTAGVGLNGGPQEITLGHVSNAPVGTEHMGYVKTANGWERKGEGQAKPAAEQDQQASAVAPTGDRKVAVGTRRSGPNGPEVMFTDGQWAPVSGPVLREIEAWKRRQAPTTPNALSEAWNWYNNIGTGKARP